MKRFDVLYVDEKRETKRNKSYIRNHTHEYLWDKMFQHIDQ